MDLLKRIMKKVSYNTDENYNEKLLEEINIYESAQEYLTGSDGETLNSNYGLYLMGSKNNKKLS